MSLLPDDNGTTVVNVGLNFSWGEAISVLLHELYELTLIDLSTRYEVQPSYSRGSSDFMFFMSHNQLGEAHDRVGDALVKILPDFSNAYKKCSRYED